MTDVSQTTSTSGTTSATATSKTLISSDFDTFLKMMTTQIENQDPLNPLDASEYAIQLATFSGVEQQAKTNSLLSQMMSQQTAGSLASMADWVGKSVRVEAAAIYEGNPISVSAKPEDDASSAQLVIKDSSGVERNRIDIPVKESTVEWSGIDSSGSDLAWGTYELSVESFDSQGTEIDSSTPQIYTKVTEARRSGDGINLVLAGGTVVNIDDVSAVRVE